MSDRRPVWLFSHTHWDREWYRPFEAFRYRLVEVVDSVLDLLERGGYETFLLDGQTIVLDDYLEMRPENAGRLRALIAAGRLEVGPWYVLPDEALVSGESLIRNLAIGQGMATGFGRAGDVGYLPDMFGHVAQMPAILAGFGLQRAVVWRGVQPERADFRWQGLDGQNVLALHLPIGYYNTAFIEQDTAALTKQLADLASKHPGPVIIPDGGDHLAPSDTLPTFLATLGETLPAYDFRQVTLSAALASLPPVDEARPVVHGELRFNGGAYVLPGVLSTRPYLKQANHRLQLLISHWAEPLATWATLQGASYPQAFLDHAWRLLLQNQPHDSICGCSVDEVHREMMPRFERGTSVADTVIERSLAALGAVAAPAEGGVLIVNPLPTPYNGPVTIDMDWASGAAPEGLSLWQGCHQIPSTASGPVETRRFLSDIRELPRWEDVTRRQVTFWATVPGFGVQTLIPRSMFSEAVTSSLQSGDDWIDTGVIRLSAGTNGVSLSDHRSGLVWSEALRFVDDGDAGDTYNYSPPGHDEQVVAECRDVRVVPINAWQSEMVLSYDWSLPAGVTEDRQGRSTARVAMPFKVRLQVTADSPLVAVTVAGEHTVKDHRWRMLWRMPTAVAAWSDTAFGAVTRALPDTVPPIDVDKGKERAEPTFPITNWASLEQAAGGIALITGGLAEGEILPRSEETALAVTLMRAVGWLSRDDLRTRGGGAGPAFPTPEAQCPGAYEATLWLLPYVGDWQSAHVTETALQAQVGVRTWQGVGRGDSIDWPVHWPTGMVFSAAMIQADPSPRVLLRGFAADGRPSTGSILWRNQAGTPCRLDGQPWYGAVVPSAIQTSAFGVG